MFDVTALGELLIDFTPAGLSKQGNICFERNPGGAPANVLACVSKLGGNTSFIGKVGNDIFGEYLAQTLKDLNIDTSGLMFSNHVNTTLAFVQLDNRGDRAFSFYRNPGADTTLSCEEINFNTIKNSKVFHFGSLSLTDEPSKSATVEALKFAKSYGCVISFDPNLRPALWKSLGRAKEEIISGLAFCDILKISEEELEFITQKSDSKEGSLMLYNDYGIDVILVTLGPKGCFYRLKYMYGSRNSFDSCKTIDTTGAGDAFLGSFLYKMLKMNANGVNGIDLDALEEMVVFANAAASLSTTKNGGIPSMPTLEEVKNLLNS